MKRQILFHRLLLLLLISLLEVSFFSDALDDLSLHSGFASVEAEKLFQSFNLFPRRPINVADHDPLALSASASEIVEKPLRFSNLISGSNDSVQELGHHAGYYKIKHSHAARLILGF